MATCHLTKFYSLELQSLVNPYKYFIFNTSSHEPMDYMHSPGFPTSRNPWNSSSLTYFFQILCHFLKKFSYNLKWVFMRLCLLILYLLSHIHVFWVVKLASIVLSQNNLCELFNYHIVGVSMYVSWYFF